MNFWPFTTKTETGELLGKQLSTDYHAHWLPGIDDGAKGLTDSIEMLRAFEMMGYQSLVATPHIIAGLYPNSRKTVETALALVKEEAQQQQINLTLGAAAEYMLDEEFDRHLDDGPLLCIRDNYVLVEQSMLQPSPGAAEKIFAMQVKGYQPVLAHPERYGFLHSKKLEYYTEFKEMGCLFQLNLLSLTGYYGKPIQQTAAALLKEGYYDLAGSDAHHMRHMEKLAAFTFDVKQLVF